MGSRFGDRGWISVRDFGGLGVRGSLVGDGRLRLLSGLRLYRRLSRSGRNRVPSSRIVIALSADVIREANGDRQNEDARCRYGVQHQLRRDALDLLNCFAGYLARLNLWLVGRLLRPGI